MSEDLARQVVDKFGPLQAITEEEMESVMELKDLLNNSFDDATPAVMRVIFDGEPAICIVAHYTTDEGGEGLQAVALLADGPVLRHITDVHGDPAVPMTGVTQGNSTGDREDERDE